VPTAALEDYAGIEHSACGKEIVNHGSVLIRGMGRMQQAIPIASY